MAEESTEHTAQKVRAKNAQDRLEFAAANTASEAAKDATADVGKSFTATAVGASSEDTSGAPQRDSFPDGIVGTASWNKAMQAWRAKKSAIDKKLNEKLAQ